VTLERCGDDVRRGKSFCFMRSSVLAWAWLSPGATYEVMQRSAQVGEGRAAYDSGVANKDGQNACPTQISGWHAVVRRRVRSRMCLFVHPWYVSSRLRASDLSDRARVSRSVWTGLGLENVYRGVK